MGKTTKWAEQKLTAKDGLTPEEIKYYKVFNQIYYLHKKPTEEDCILLKITMERALQLRKEGSDFENRCRRDAMLIANYQKPVQYERVTNRKLKLIHEEKDMFDWI